MRTTVLLISIALLGAAMANQAFLAPDNNRPALDTLVPFKHNVNFTEQTFRYFSCDGPLEDAAWTYARNFGTLRCGHSLYLARFGKSETDYVNANIATPDRHQGVAIRGRLVAIDEWKDETFIIAARTTEGGDFVPVYTRTFDNINNVGEALCGQTEIQDTATVFFFGFAHNLATLDLRIYAELDGAECANAWGVCDLEIQTVACTLKPDGTCQDHPEFPCFKPIYQADWFYSDGYRMETCGTQRYLGRYGLRGHQQYIEKTYEFTDSCPIRGYRVSANLQFIESWDGEEFQFFANGQLAHSESRYYQDGTQVCFSATWPEHINQKVVFGVNATTSQATQTLVLRITSTLNQDVDDEGWGICDITVTPQNCRVNKDGECIRLEPRLYTFFSTADTATAGWTVAGGAGVLGTYQVGQRPTFGRFGQNDIVTKTFDNLPAHQSVTIRFRLYSLDSWDGESFTVAVNGETVQNIAFRWRDQHRIELNGVERWPEEYRNVEFTVAHNDAALTLTFSSTLDQAINDEAWSISDVVVFVNPCAAGEAPAGDQYCPAGGNLAGNLNAVSNNGATGEINFGTHLYMDECRPVTPQRDLCNNGCATGDSYIYPLLKNFGNWFRFGDQAIFWRLL